jgi:hypothetical protein
MQFHAPLEIDVYIREALQTFNAYANFYRQEFVFETIPGQPWYDITEEPLSLRPMTTTDHDLFSIIEYHLLEPQTPTYPLDWEGSRQFCMPDLVRAVQQNRDKTLSEAGCTVYQSLIPAVPGRTFLSNTVMDIRRMCWLPNPYQRQFRANMVQPSDLWATQSYHALFPQRGPGTPLIYRRTTEPPVSFDVDIEPAVTGHYDLLTTDQGPNLLFTEPTILQIPNDWCHVAKYGALAELFGRESAAKDALREDYCDNRYKQGTAFMQTAPAILGARINNVPIIVNAMSNGDFYFANWQSRPHGRPIYIFYSGLNMLALAPIPKHVFSVTIECVRNMPLPFEDDDCLVIRRDDFRPVLDLAQHVAMLKVGGEEFTRTYPLYKDFLRHCALYNSKLKAASLWLEWLDGRAQETIKVNPIFSPMADPVSAQNGGQSSSA